MTLTDTEVRVLLGHAMAYDNRKVPGEANRAAWVEASRRNNWTLDAALEALHQHYATSSEFVMPGHLTQLIRAERRQPAPFVPEPPPPAIEAAVAEVTRALPSTSEPTRPIAFSRWRPARRRRRMDAAERAAITAELDRARPAEPESTS